VATNLARLIDSFQNLNLLVVGDAMLDSYLAGTARSICREAPVPVVSLASRVDVPGGAANTAVNVRRLGGRVAFLSTVGDDLEGGLLRRALAGAGVDTDAVLVCAGRQTLAKHRVIAGSQLLVRFDQGSTGPVGAASERELIARLSDLFPRCDAVIISDYGYGILTPRLIARLAELQAGLPRVIVADSRHLPAFRDVGITAVKPNYAEAVELLGLRPDSEEPRADAVAARAEQLLGLTGARVAAVTLDAEGAIVLERGSSPYRTYSRPVRSALAAGAGDTFLGALALAYAAGADTPAAAEIASAAGSIVVAKEGTASCSGEELRVALAADGKYVTELDRLVARLEFYRQQGRRIVFTNGCFDILHRGHVTYLSRAKALGDVLVVGINSDAGVRRLKGAERPINTLEDRAQVLAALSCVDHLVAFDEPTPVGLIRALRPDVFVKGGDYTRATLPEASVVEQLGGVVHILPYLPDRSTTGIIDRIRAAASAGAALTERAVGQAQQK
jgi:D-beta-D-heptose 7-phosphate kinase / D-beta-D-heptose 1-phosphate adenosyltransferase